MAAVKAEDVRASFLFAVHLNGHHQEWLGSRTMNRHSVAAFDFATVYGCDQHVVGPIFACGGTLGSGHHLGGACGKTDIPDLVRVLLFQTVFGHLDGSGSSKLVLVGSFS